MGERGETGEQVVIVSLLTWHSSLGEHSSKRTESCKEFKMSVTRKIFVMSHETIEIWCTRVIIIKEGANVVMLLITVVLSCFFFVRELLDQLAQREKLVAEDKRFVLRTKRTKWSKPNASEMTGKRLHVLCRLYLSSVNSYSLLNPKFVSTFELLYRIVKSNHRYSSTFLTHIWK